MDIANYFASNIPLFSISAVIVFIALRNIKIRRKESILFLVFTAIVLLLSVVVEVEDYAQLKGLVVLGTVFTSFGYIFRPILLYIFVLLANMEQKRKRRFYVLCSIPLLANFIIYMFPLFFGVPGISTLVFYYKLEETGMASFNRGTFLNFFSHAISVFYLVVLFYVSTIRFHGKHRRDGLVFILCDVIILATVATEVATGRSDLLNIVCEICAMINYIFIVSVNTSRDPLTNLYDRRTFYEDVSRYKNIVNGFIQIDMNELKFLNDNYGHDRGDLALTALAETFENSINQSTMCAYRLSGDEFVILMFQGNLDQLEKTVLSIKAKIEESNYSAAIGYYFIDPKVEKVSFEEAMKKAEELMYIDKAKYYKESGHDRRTI